MGRLRLRRARIRRPGCAFFVFKIDPTPAQSVFKAAYAQTQFSNLLFNVAGVV
jgi:hypothetical protein